MALERTGLLRDDLDWLPASMKALRWMVAGSIWGGLATGIGALTVVTHGAVAFWLTKGAAAGALGGWFAGDRAARAVMRGRLRRLARGASDLRRFASEPDGELLHVRGRVRARETVPSLLVDHGSGVYRRLVYAVGSVRLVHEVAVDFALVEERQAGMPAEEIAVAVEGARLLGPEPGLETVTARAEDALLGLQLPPRADEKLEHFRQRRRLGRHVPPLIAGEVLLREGDEVSLVGYKSRTVDPTVESYGRDLPLRATLRAGRALPLLIAMH